MASPQEQSSATRGRAAADGCANASSAQRREASNRRLENLLPVIRLRGTPFHAITEAQCIGHVLDELDAGRGGWIVTANLDFLRRLCCDRDFAALCAKATLLVADGMPLVWASWLQGTPLPERVAGSALTWSLTLTAGARGRSVFLVGGAPGTADAAASILCRRSPRVRIAGTACPEMGFERNPQAVIDLTETICAARPDIVYVALGSPKQELLIDRLRHRLPATWWMGVGISFSYLCGHVHRAPGWVQRIGLEWLHRLAQEPRRLARRYLLHGIPFGLLLLGGSAWSRVLRSHDRMADSMA